MKEASKISNPIVLAANMQIDSVNKMY